MFIMITWYQEVCFLLCSVSRASSFWSSWFFQSLELVFLLFLQTNLPKFCSSKELTFFYFGGILIFINVRKRYSRRKNIAESLQDDKLNLQRIKLTRHLTHDLLRFNDIESCADTANDNLDDCDNNIQILNSIVEEVSSSSQNGKIIL